MNTNDLKYEECPSCEDDAALLVSYQKEDIRYWFVECGECEYRTNEYPAVAPAVYEWNGEEEVEEEEEDGCETVAALVRMLEAERTAHEELRVRYNTRKMQQFEAAYGSKMDEISLVSKAAITELEKENKHIRGEMKKANSLIQGLREDEARIQKDLRIALEGKHRAEDRLSDWEHARFLIDTTLVSIEISEDYPDVAPIMPRVDLFKAIRSKEWPPPSNLKTFDTPLWEIIYLSSPYGMRPNSKLYWEAIHAHLTTNSTKSAMVSAVYGFAMEHFGQGTRGYTLAWDALGRPGETKHDDRRPRT